MAAKTLPSRDLIRELLSYDPATGQFMWLPRPREMFDNKRIHRVWNGKYAGRYAGTTLQNGYLRICINDSRYLAHRLAWLLIYDEPVPERLDHIDCNPRNNNISNLRPATQAQNLWNARKHRDNTSGIKGVSLDRGRYVAQVAANGILHRLTFHSLEEAVLAHRELAEKLHGVFARCDESSNVVDITEGKPAC